MIVLILTACMAAYPGHCRVDRIPLGADATLQVCSVLTMPMVAAWAGEHPSFVIKSFRCETAGHDGQA